MPYTTYRLLSEQIMIGCQLSDGSKFLSSVLAVIQTALFAYNSVSRTMGPLGVTWVHPTWGRENVFWDRLLFNE